MDQTFYGTGSGMPLYQAVQQYDRRARAAGAVDAQEESMGTAPPGWEPSIKRMKKHGDVDNPWALAWWMRRRGYQPATHVEGKDDQFDASVTQAVAVSRTMGLPKEYRAAAKGEVWAQSMLLDPYLPPLVLG